MESDSRELGQEAIEFNRSVARQTQLDLVRQFQPRLKSNTSVRLYNTSTGAIVSLGRLESILATPGGTIASGNMWLLTEEGKRLGFKRITLGNSWDKIKRQHGDRLFVRGDTAFYRKDGRIIPVYQRQREVRVKQLVDLEATADRNFDNTQLGA